MLALHGSEVADIGKEPSFLTPCLYKYVNRNHRSVETIRYLVSNRFSIGPKALSVNSNAGTMQGWYFFALVGFYPGAGTTTYLLSSPFVVNTKIKLQNGSQVEISTKNLQISTSKQSNSMVILISRTGSSIAAYSQMEAPWSSLLEPTFGANPVFWDTGPVPPSPGHCKLPNP